MSKLFALLTVASLLNASPAFSAEIRPHGFIERGAMIATPDGDVFVPDSERNAFDGRYFRASRNDAWIFYGIGQHPGLDAVIPAWRPTAALKDYMSSSPAAMDRLLAYDEQQLLSEGWARLGLAVACGAVVACIGGFVYDRLPNNAREMQPSFYLGMLGLASAGGTAYGVANWVTGQNLATLDDAINAYNKDVARKR